MKSDLKIGHVPFTGSMYISSEEHMHNMSNLESKFGIESIVLPSIGYYNISNMPIDFDIIHIHGIPPINEAYHYINFIMNLYLHDIKFVISLYNYGNICDNFILRNNQFNKCNSPSCVAEDCLRLKQLFNFMKDVNIFVYSDYSLNIYKQSGYKNIYKLPIITNYDKIEFEYTNNTKPDTVGALIQHDHFKYENDKLRNYIKDQNVKDIDIYNNNFQSKCIIPYLWQCSFPYELCCCLANGSKVICHNEYIFDEYKFGIEYIDINQPYDINSSFSIDEMKLLAYEYWKKYGPHHCISFLDAYYREIMK